MISNTALVLNIGLVLLLAFGLYGRWLEDLPPSDTRFGKVYRAQPAARRVIDLWLGMLVLGGLLRMQIHYGILDPGIKAYVAPLIGGPPLVLGGLSLVLLASGALKARRN